MSRFTSGLLLVAVSLCGAWAPATYAQQMVYNPITGRTEPDRNSQSARLGRLGVPAPAPPATESESTEPTDVEQTSFAEPCNCGAADCGACAAMGCGNAVGCGDVVCGESVCGDAGCGDSLGCGSSGVRCFAGLEATFLQPRFERNLAFSLQEGDGARTESTTDREFNYDLAFAPRVFVGVEHCNGVGFLATWWQFDEAADSLSANPPANGFGRLSPPAFGDVDIATNVPTDLLTATSGLKAYTIDLEVTKSRALSCWTLGVAGGLRYAHVEQNYLAETTNANGAALGRIDYRHELQGIGPTIMLGASTPLGYRLELFGKARGSLLFGDGSSRLTAGEDLDLTNSFTTNNLTERDDLLPIAEVQIGLTWRALTCARQVWRPFATVALEGQSWGGAGSASSEEGNLGFFGISSGIGASW